MVQMIIDKLNTSLWIMIYGPWEAVDLTCVSVKNNT